MDLQLWLSFLLGVAVATVFTWIGCRVAYGKKVRASMKRAETSEQARQFAAQQTQQARKQIESLQALLASRQRAASPLPLQAASVSNASPVIAMRPLPALPSMPAVNSARLKLRPDQLTELLAASEREATRHAGSDAKTGFADTQILS